MGYSPGLTRTLTHQVGPWAWDSKKLHAKQRQGTTDECWEWIGSKGPHGNLFGAYKQGTNGLQQQMTQANRLLYMEQVNEPIDDISVTMKCANKYCCNPSHFEIMPNKRTMNRL
jgi:hypothetical protein